MQLLSFLKRNWQKNWFAITLLLLITSLTFVTLLFRGYFNHHDDLQVMRIFEMEKCFADWQIPCRWIPDMGYGYGYPLFNFYPPLPAFLGVLIRFITFYQIQIVDTVKITFALQFLLSATLMYLFARKWFGKMGGFLASLFYTFAPYHAVDLYVRGAQNEAYAMAFAPGVGWAMTQLFENISFNNIVLMAIMFAGMLLSHNIMVLIFTPLFLIFGLYLVVLKRSVKLLLAFAAGGALATGIAAFFTLPVLLEQKYVHIETLYIGFFNYIVHFATINQLFFARFWGYGGSIFGIHDIMAFPIGWLHWIGVAAIMLVMIYLVVKRQWRYLSLLAIFVFYFWLTAFLAHEQSSEIFWKKIPVLHTLQFPWRFLSTVAFTSSFVIGGFFILPLPTMVKKTIFVSLSFAVVALNLSFFHVEHRFPEVTDAYKLSGKLWDQQRTSGIFDYLPIYAIRPPGRPAPGGYQIIAGDARVANYVSGSASVSFQTSAAMPSLVRLNIFDFPNWKIWLDGQEIKHDHENYLGLITFGLPAGDHSIKAKLTNTPVRTFGNILSVLVLVGLSGCYVMKFVKKSKIGSSPT